MIRELRRPLGDDHVVRVRALRDLPRLARRQVEHLEGRLRRQLAAQHLRVDDVEAGAAEHLRHGGLDAAHLVDLAHHGRLGADDARGPHEVGPAEHAMRPELLRRQHEHALAVERLAAPAAGDAPAADARAAPLADRHLERVDVDLGRDGHLQDVPVDVLRHHRRARHERRRAIVDRVVGRVVIPFAGRADAARHLPHRRAQRARDRLRPRQRPIATDDDRVPLGRHRRPPRLGAHREQREGDDGEECGVQRASAIASHAP